MPPVQTETEQPGDRARSSRRRGKAQAALPLAECALRDPADVIQALQIVRGLARLAESPERREALRRLRAHPARHVRAAARRIDAQIRRP